MSSNPSSTIRQVTDAFNQVGIPYLIGGSVASTIHGIFRYTQDVDFVVDLRTDNVGPLVDLLKDRFYIDADMMYEAIEHNSSFSLLDLNTFVKIDVFTRMNSEWTEAEWNRTVRRRMKDGDLEFEAIVSSAEDMILHKLRWFHLGGGVSDRQWNDVQGMLRVQAETLDLEYLRLWAEKLALLQTLEEAFSEAGLK